MVKNISFGAVSVGRANVCDNCRATDFDILKDGRWQCKYCNTTYGEARTYSYSPSASYFGGWIGSSFTSIPLR